jgi:integrase
MQNGRVFQKGPSWFLHYNIPILKDGKKRWKGVIKKLAPVDDRFPSKRSVEPLARQVLEPINDSGVRPDATQPLADFIEYVYFPNIQKRPSTVRGYKHIFTRHLKSRLGKIRILDFTTGKGQKLLRDIANDVNLSHNSLKHIKHFLTGVFTFAKQEEVLNGENPMRDVGIPEGVEQEGNRTYAYSLEEIIAMLEALSEPAKIVVATAAFTGLRRSELRGLRWGDLRGDELHISRTVWETHVEDKTKTRASRASVPVVPLLQKWLEAHRNSFTEDGFIFAGPKTGRPLNLANLARRVIVPKLREAGIEWHGWHALRRGLATNLFRLGVPDLQTQKILRHANVSTTRESYIKPVQADSRAAMAKLEKAFKSAKKKK